MVDVKVYISGQYSLALVCLIPSWLVWAKVHCTLHAALSKWPINQFKQVQQSSKQVLRAYLPDNYTLQGHHGEFELGKAQYSTPIFFDRLFLIRVN